MLIWRGADQRRPKRRPVSQVTDRGALSGAQPRDLLLDIDAVVGQFDIPRQGTAGSASMICIGSSNCSQNRAARLRMAVDHGVHGITQPKRIKPTTQRDIQLHRIHIVAAAVRDAGVKQQSLLQGGEWQVRQRSGIAGSSSSICCWLSWAGAISDGVKSAPTAPHSARR